MTRASPKPLFWATCLPQAITTGSSPRASHSPPMAAARALPPPPHSNISISFPEPPGYQCHNTEHYKLTIHRDRQSKSRSRVALKGLGYIALGIIIFIRIKLALMNMFPLLFECLSPLLLTCKSALVTRDYGAALGWL